MSDDIGVRELRSQLAEVVSAAIRGETTYITQHGRRVAAIVPLAIADRHATTDSPRVDDEKPPLRPGGQERGR